MARDNNRPQRRQERDDGLCKKLIAVNRITKVVKGGRKMRFSALVVVGDENGKVGCGSGKANEVLRKVSTVGTTIPHAVVGKFGRGSVIMMPAEEGTGVIAGGPVRAVMEAAGIKNIRTKSHGSSNPVNMVKAVITGLNELRTAEQVAALRGKSAEEIMA